MTAVTRVLAAGDQFVLNRLFADALHHEVPSQKGSRGLEVRELDLPWPDEPMGPVAEVFLPEHYFANMTPQEHSTAMAVGTDTLL